MMTAWLDAAEGIARVLAACTTGILKEADNAPCLYRKP